MWSNVLLWGAAVVGLWVVGGCGRPDEALESNVGEVASASVGDPALNWETYEDDSIRIRYPKGRKTVGPREAKDKSGPRGYIVMGPKDPPTEPGPDAIYITEAPEKLDSNLREIMQSRLKRGAKEDVRPLGAAEEVLRPGGRCLMLMSEGYTVGGCESYGESHPTCFMDYLVAECRSKGSQHFTITSYAGSYPERGKLDDRSREQIKVFERVVKSIEFK